MPHNPFLSFDVLPDFAGIRPAHVSPAVDQLLADAAAAVNTTADNTAPPTWDDVCAPVDAACENITRVWNQVELMHSVMSSDEWRAAHHENLAKIAAFYAALGQDAGLYRRLQALYDSPAFADLSPTRQKIVTDGLRDFKLSGVALPDAEKTSFRQNCERLALLSAKFEENLLNATCDFTLAVADEADLGDMPEDLRAIAQHAAAPADGWRFSLQPPSFMAFMKYVENRSLRERMYRAYHTRASEFDLAERDNTPVIAEILTLRQRQADLLGFGDYAEVALQTRAAATPAAVRDFLFDMVGRARPAAEREANQLRQFAAEQLGIPDLQAWDVVFASEKLRRRQFDFSDAELRAYLQEDKILAGLFACVQRLFGITTRPQAVPVWHEDVRYLEVVAADGRVLGGLYLDLYARETKRGGAWMADALSRCRRDGRLQLPVAHLCCNFAKPADGRAALMNWDEVVTLFHEFGHALHHILTEVEEYSASGISGVEWDAVELPSQWLENFIWDYQVLAPMTAHVESGDPMPRVLFDKALAARQFQTGLWLTRQLEFSLFDLFVHHDHAGDVMTALAEARRRAAVLMPPPENRFACGFSHIFAGGYAAGYYGYLWAEVLAADIFAMFRAAPDVLDADLGAQLRREILAVGGSRPAMESFVAMRSRPPKIDALLAQYGLTASAA